MMKNPWKQTFLLMLLVSSCLLLVQAKVQVNVPMEQQPQEQQPAKTNFWTSVDEMTTTTSAITNAKDVAELTDDIDKHTLSLLSPVNKSDSADSNFGSNESSNMNTSTKTKINNTITDTTSSVSNHVQDTWQTQPSAEKISLINSKSVNSSNNDTNVSITGSAGKLIVSIKAPASLLLKLDGSQLKKSSIQFLEQHSQFRRRRPTKEFDFLLLSIQWPIYLCSQRECIRNPSQSWGIHGLWPNKLHGKHPFNCDPSHELNLTAIASLQSELREKWFSPLADRTTESFWQYEWHKHGTCALNSAAGGNEYNYFSSALRLFNENPIAEWLEQANILPSEDPYRLVPLDAIGEAISAKRAFDFQIKCRQLNVHDESEQRVSVLESIQICFDKDLNSINCPRGGSCGKQVLYPTYKAPLA